MSTEMKNVPSERLVSIDALRGFDMFWIMGADAFFGSLFQLIGFTVLARQVEHSAWNGFTFYDLIFPLFLFIVGASMPFSIGKRLERGDSRKGLTLHIVKRTLLLFALGLVYNHILDLNFQEFRWAGVLQRIALCYCLTALIVMNTKTKGQAVAAAAILLAYWAVMKWVRVPGFGAGVLTPEANLAGYIDRQILPGKFCCYTFGDNEGLLSTLPAVSTTLLGVLAGQWLRSIHSQKKKTLGLLAGGVAGLALGLLWNLVFPINKLIWTGSYVLYAGGWSLLLLGLFYWLIDVRGHRKWAFPFVVIGLNPITIYVAQGVFDFAILSGIAVHGFIHRLGTVEPLFDALCVLTVKWLFLYFLYRQKIFLKA